MPKVAQVQVRAYQGSMQIFSTRHSDGAMCRFRLALICSHGINPAPTPLKGATSWGWITRYFRCWMNRSHFKWSTLAMDSRAIVSSSHRKAWNASIRCRIQQLQVQDSAKQTLSVNCRTGDLRGLVIATSYEHVEREQQKFAVYRSVPRYSAAYDEAAQ